MGNAVNVLIPVDAEAARALENPALREAAGQYLSSLLKEGHLGDILANAIAAIKAEAHANGLTNDDIDAEVRLWSVERPSNV